MNIHAEQIVAGLRADLYGYTVPHTPISMEAVNAIQKEFIVVERNETTESLLKIENGVLGIDVSAADEWLRKRCAQLERENQMLRAQMRQSA